MEALWSNEDSAGSLESSVEVKKEVTTNTVQISDNIFVDIETKDSSWPKLKRKIGYVMIYKKKLLHWICDKGNPMQNSGTNGNILWQEPAELGINTKGRTADN